jgi:Spy/CpxP family protein refolding chaperone
MVERMVEQLDLTEEQGEQLRQLFADQRDATEEIRQQIEAAHDRVQQQVDAEQLDEAAIREAAAELSTAQTEMFLSRAQTNQQLRQILTAEQYEDLIRMRERHHKRMQRHPGRFHDGQGHHERGGRPSRNG